MMKDKKKIVLVYCDYDLFKNYLIFYCLVIKHYKYALFLIKYRILSTKCKTLVFFVDT